MLATLYKIMKTYVRMYIQVNVDVVSLLKEIIFQENFVIA